MTYESVFPSDSIVVSASPPIPSEFTPIFSPPSCPVLSFPLRSLAAQRPELYHILVGATQSSVFAQSLLGDSVYLSEGFEPKKPRRAKAKEPTRRRSRKKQPDFNDNALLPAIPTLSNAPMLPAPSPFPLLFACNAGIRRWSPPSPTLCPSFPPNPRCLLRPIPSRSPPSSSRSLLIPPPPSPSPLPPNRLRRNAPNATRNPPRPTRKPSLPR